MGCLTSKSNKMAANKSVEEWQEQFKQFDKDNNGSLTIYELRDLMRSSDSNIPDSQIAEIFISFEGPTGDKRITLDEFVSGMDKLQGQIQKVTDLFKEADKDGSGYLTKDELRPLITNVYPSISDSEMEQIFESADKSGEGKISLDEFLSTCT